MKAFWTIGSPCSLKHVRPRARLVGCSGTVQKDEAEAGTELQSVADHVVSASACFCRSRKAWLPTCSHIANCTSTKATTFWDVGTTHHMIIGAFVCLLRMNCMGYAQCTIAQCTLYNSIQFRDQPEFSFP